MEYKENPQEEEQKPDAQEQEEYSFMQETIKDETGSPKKTKNLVLKYAGLGLVFGLAASLGFFALKPWAETKFQSDPKKVTIPEEEEETEEEQNKEEEAPPATLNIGSYREINQALRSVADEVNKSVVDIRAVSADAGWQKEGYDAVSSVSGLLVADNGQSLLVLGKSSILKDADSLAVTFADGKTYGAQLKRKDENLGFAIFSVARSDIQESTWNQAEIAVLGSSNSVVRGEGVIALGQPFGYSSGVGFGIISSPKNTVEKADAQYKVLCTDIAAANGGTGILANTRGEVIGMIDQGITEGESMSMVTAYGISDMKDTLKLLLNGSPVPYVGIMGTVVTKEVAQQQDIPQGVYVKKVQEDSPAMAAGIQSGDIITKMDGKPVETLFSYRTELMEQTVGNAIKIKGQRQGAGGYVDIDFTVTIGSKE